MLDCHFSTGSCCPQYHSTNVALKCRPGSLLLLLLTLPPGSWVQAAAADPWLVWLRVAAPHQLHASDSQCQVGGGRAMISARTHRTGLTWCYATAACRAKPRAVHGAHVQKCTEALWRCPAPGCSGGLRGVNSP